MAKRSRYARARRPRRRSARTFVKKAVRKAKRSLFRKRVKRIIQQSAEVKHISVRGTKTTTVLRTGTISYAQNAWILTPLSGANVATYGGYSIGIGSQDGQREGNRVALKKSMFNVSITVKPYGPLNVIPVPQVCRLYFFRTKANQQTAPFVNEICGSTGNFFQDGTGNTAFIGSLADMNMHMNSDRYTYLGHKTIKLGYSMYEGMGSTGPGPNNQYFANNDFKLNYTRRINVTKFMPKTFTWDDTGNSITPFTWVLIQSVNADGTTAAIDTELLTVIYEQYNEYTDI